METAPKTNLGGDEDSDDENDGKTAKKTNKATSRNDEDSSDDEVEDQEDAKLTSKHEDQQQDQEPDDEEEKKDAENDDESDGEDENEQANESDGNVDTSVVDSYSLANAYKENKEHRWSELTFSLPMSYKKLDLTCILKDVASSSVIWETPNIKRAITYTKDKEYMLRTDGINVGEMCKYQDLLDLNRLYCNDIHKMAETYGIEAASKIIVKEVKDVFDVYGIKVDPRHLSLIADYMTSNGSFEPLSRKGMETSSSPLQQMSFESSLQFLKVATAKGKKDDLKNPSSSLMIGKPSSTGTGIFGLLQKMPDLSF